MDKWGNDGADALAVRGASEHRAPENIVQSSMDRVIAARIVQRMMVAVLQARFRADPAHAIVTGDRGSVWCSDCGDVANDLIWAGSEKTLISNLVQRHSMINLTTGTTP